MHEAKLSHDRSLYIQVSTVPHHTVAPPGQYSHRLECSQDRYNCYSGHLFKHSTSYGISIYQLNSWSSYNNIIMHMHCLISDGT